MVGLRMGLSVRWVERAAIYIVDAGRGELRRIVSRLRVWQDSNCNRAWHGDDGWLDGSGEE